MLLWHQDWTEEMSTCEETQCQMLSCSRTHRGRRGDANTSPQIPSPARHETACFSMQSAALQILQLVLTTYQPSWGRECLRQECLIEIGVVCRRAKFLAVRAHL